MKITATFLTLIILILPSISFSSDNYSKDYNRLMLNLGLVLGFDAVKGNVKNYYVVAKDQDNKIVEEISLEFDKNGCIDYIKLFSADAKLKTKEYRKVDNHLSSSDPMVGHILLDENCQLIGLEDDIKHLTYSSNNDGLIDLMTFSSNDINVFTRYVYNKNEFPLNIKYYAGSEDDLKVEIVYEYTDELNKPYDYQYINRLMRSFQKRTCTYDDISNPVTCEIKKYDDDTYTTIKSVLNVKYEITYY